MFRFLKRSRKLGVEITPSAVRVVSLSAGSSPVLLSAAAAQLPEEVLSASYTSLNIHEPDRLIEALRNCIQQKPGVQSCAGLCLPDGVFRIQAVEFDELPKKAQDRERLIRWRLEKSGAFDLSETLLRYQVLKQDQGFSILACIAKKAVIEQYESVLIQAGIQPWFVSLSSFSLLNFYGPYLIKKSAAYALTHLTEDSFATIVCENGGARFYRFKEIKKGSGEINSRLVREIEDSLHFYSHMDRSQQTDLRHLYVCAEPALGTGLAGQLSTDTSLDVEVLSPGMVLGSSAQTGADMAAALGAGRTI